MVSKVERIVCWGIGREYRKIKPVLDKEINQGTIQVVACVDKDKGFGGYEYIIPPDMLEDVEFDYVIICSSIYRYEIRDDIIRRGISEDRIIYGGLLNESGFDFLQYKKSGWLNNCIINSKFSDDSYKDEKRSYKGKNIVLSLGRKSYIGEMTFERGDLRDTFSLNVGNYSCISWGIRVEIGLNLDHDYHRIMNYGITHFDSENLPPYDYSQSYHSIEIGSDVWIGRGSALKSGIRIGDGAVVAANSNVVSDVDDFAIVGGNPARLIKYRFDRDLIASIKETKWWELPERELLRFGDLFDDPQRFVEKFKYIPSIDSS